MDNIETGSDTAVAEGGAVSNEELFELIEGKNQDGSPIKKQLTRAEMLELAQKGFGANKTFEETATIKKQMKEFAAMLRDPEQAFEVLRKFGHDPDKLMTGAMARQMIENMKTPEEKEIEQLRRDAELYRQSESKRLQEEEERSISESATAKTRELYGLIENVLNTAGVDQSKETVGEVARYIKQMMNTAERQGKEFKLSELPLDAIVQHLESRRDSFFGWLDNLSDEQLLSRLGDKRQKRIGSALTKMLTQGTSGVVDINSFERKNKIEATAEAPSKKYLSSQEADDLAAKRIAEAQAIWDRKNRK